MKLRSALLATAMLASSLAAANAQVAGPYIGLGGGLNIMQNEEIKSWAAFPSPARISSSIWGRGCSRRGLWASATVSALSWSSIIATMDWTSWPARVEAPRLAELSKNTARW